MTQCGAGATVKNAIRLSAAQAAHGVLALLVVLALLMAGGQPQSANVTLLCAGDVMLGRNVARTCRRRGLDYPFVQVAPTLRAADLTFANLESPLSAGARFPRVNALIAPEGAVAALARAGFDVLSLANNHAIDGERSGLRHTIVELRRRGLTPVGAGETKALAEAGAIRTVRGLRIGFLAYSDFPYTNFVYDPTRTTIVMLNEGTLRRTIPAVARRCDFLVVYFHWGKEGCRRTSSYQRRLAHLAVDLGANLVVGSHPHVRGEIERYRGALIAYDLGNLVFDDDSYGGNEGYLLRCRLARKRLVSYALLPVTVRNCQARLAAGNLP